MRNLTITVTGTQQKKVYIRVLANDVPITRGKLTSRPGESEIKFRANTCAYHRRRISSVFFVISIWAIGEIEDSSPSLLTVVTI